MAGKGALARSARFVISYDNRPASGTSRESSGGRKSHGSAFNDIFGTAERLPGGRGGGGLRLRGSGPGAGKRQDDADRHSGSAAGDRDRHRPAPRRDGSRIVAHPIWQP